MIKIQENHTYSIYEIRFRRILKVCKKKKKNRKKFFDFIIHDAIFWVIHHLSLFRFFPLSLKRLASLVDELLGAKTMGKNTCYTMWIQLFIFYHFKIFVFEIVLVRYSLCFINRVKTKWL